MAINDTIMGVATGTLGISFIVIAIVVIIGIVWLSMWLYSNWRKYQDFKIIIWERDGLGNIRQLRDNAGIFVDKKTNNKRLFLKRANVGLEPDNVPYVIDSDGKKLVYLVRRGLKNFQFIKPNITESNFAFRVTEEDVNWAINAYERQKKIFQGNSLLQYLPFIMLAFVSIIILVIFIYFFKDFAVLKEVAIAMRETANALLQAKSGVILQ